MPRVLINYRRDDSAAYAGRVFDQLSDNFGPDNIFIDIDTIKPGQDFVLTIGQSVILCDAVLTIIGPRWLTEKDAAGRRRLDNPDDLVRIEIASALNRGIQMIPVLVGGAKMPQVSDLPNDLSKLARLQALEISDARFHHDVDRLIQAIRGNKVAAGIKPAWSAWPMRAIQAVLAHRRASLVALALVLLTWTAYRQLSTGSETRGAQQSSSVSAGSPVTGGPTDSAGGGRSLSTPGPALTTESASQGTISVTSEEGVEVVQGAPPPVRPLPAIGTIDKPQQIGLGATYKFMLEDVETAYLAVPPVTGLLMILDMRSTNREYTNLQSSLSVLDRDGAVLTANIIRFNEIDRGYRRMKVFSVKQKAPLILKLLNGGKAMMYFMTVFTTSRIPFVPFFGDVSPQAAVVGQSVSGALDAGEEAYYDVTLTKGRYRFILDFTNVPQQTTNIMGDLAILDAAGANQTGVIRVNEIDVAFRKIGHVTIKRDGAAIVRIQTRGSVKYTLRIAPDEGSSER